MSPWKVLALACAAAAVVLPGSALAAGGVDLTASACPATGTHVRTIDCASGSLERIEGTLTMPADMPDLIGIEAQITFDFGSTHVPPFFDFQGQGLPVLAVSTTRGPGCTAYTNTFAVSGAGGFATATTSQDSVTVLVHCLRPSALAVVAGQKVFGFTLTLDTSNSSESGVGTLVGCSTPVVAYVDWVRVDSQAGANQAFSGPDSVAGAGDFVAFNGALAPHTIAVSASGGGSGTLSSNLFPSDIEPSLHAYHVADGKGRTFTITPDAGSWLANVLVDGVSIGAPTQFTFSNVHGDHTLAAVFAAPLPTTTILSSSPNPSMFGQPVTLTAVVSPGDATGSVSFYDACCGPPALLGSAPVAAGQAALVVSGLAIGAHSFSATYGGDNAHQPSSTTGPYAHQVVPAVTTTALVTSPNPSLTGQPVTLTATVSPTPANGIQVTFFDSTTTLGSAGVSAGVAHISLSSLAVGDHPLHATFAGNAQSSASTSPTVVQAVRNPVSIALGSNVSIALAGQTVALTATLSNGSALGSVSFFDNGAPLGSVPVSNPSGLAVLATTGIQVGRRTLTASYVPCCGSIFAPVTSLGLSQLVVQPPAINSIVDVPHDQGGWVRLTMAACSLDNAGESSLPIASYGLWRHVPTASAVASPPAALARAPAAPAAVTNASLPPSLLPASSFPAGTWELVTNGPALQLPQYVIALPTISNAAPDTFVVTASTTTPAIWFISNTGSGQSQDNLAPAPPAAFGGTFAAGAHLAWDPNTEPDLAGYRLYRGATIDFTPAPGNLVATVTSSSYDDEGPGAGGYYKLSALDVNGNESGFAEAFVAGTTGVGDAPAAVFALAGAWPNPAVSGRMEVRFSLAAATRAQLALFDLGGRLVAAREVGELGAGPHVVNLGDGRTFRPGLYFLRLQQGARIETKPVVVMH